MNFVNFFKNEKEESDKKKIIGYLQKSCYESNCKDEECDECICSILDDIDLKNLQSQIIRVSLATDDFPDEISIDKNVIETALRNTISMAKSDNFRSRLSNAKELASLQTSIDTAKAFEEYMTGEIDLQTALVLLRNDSI